MLAWIALLFLIVIEVIGVRWWNASQFRSLFFNDWAATLYSGMLAVDIIIAWLISMIYQAGGTPGLQLMVVLSIAFLVIVVLATLFLHWVIHFDMTDVGKKDE